MAAFDATTAHTFTFNTVGGSQVVANKLTIKNSSNVTVYDTKQNTYGYTHKVTANTLTNGTQYTATLITYDASGNTSSSSNSIQFYCYSAPSFSFTNIPSGGLITAANFAFEVTYSQSQSEGLRSYEFFLYNVAKTQLSTSGVQSATSTTLTHTFSNLADETNYYVRCTGQTVEGTIIDTGYVSINVKYTDPTVFAAVELYNNCKGGYVTVHSNLANIPGSSLPSSPTYITGGGVDLTADGASVQWSTGYNLQGDFTASVWGYSLNNNSTILTMQDEDGGWIKVDVYTDKDDEDKSYAVLTDDDGVMVFSELIDTPYGTDKVQIWVRRNNGVYDVRYEDVDTQYVKFSSDSDFTLQTYNQTKNWDGTLEYSQDCVTWRTWSGVSILSSQNKCLYLRGYNNTYISQSNAHAFTFLGEDNISAFGNLGRLLEYNTTNITMADNTFNNLFNSPSSSDKYLILLPDVPDKHLAPYCYNGLFTGCKATTPPKLLATTLAVGCYSGMFWSSAINTLPQLPALKMEQECYKYMFGYCGRLISTTQTTEYPYPWRIPTTGTGTTATDWNEQMFKGIGWTLAPTINTTYYTTNPPV